MYNNDEFIKYFLCSGNNRELIWLLFQIQTEMTNFVESTPLIILTATKATIQYEGDDTLAGGKGVTCWKAAKGGYFRIMRSATATILFWGLINTIRLRLTKLNSQPLTARKIKSSRSRRITTLSRSKTLRLRLSTSTAIHIKSAALNSSNNRLLG